jgi:tetratricopeptide (TPR) repeat protein
MSLARISLIAASLSFFAMTVNAQTSGTQREALITLVREVGDADYKADVTRLRRLVDQLEPFTSDRQLVRAARYWRGFAFLRRSMNLGTAADPKAIERDLQSATEEFRRALVIDSTYIEAKIGLSSSLMNTAALLYRAEHERAASFMREALALAENVRYHDAENPRFVFVWAARLFWAPPEHGGDRSQAIALVQRTLQRPNRSASDALEPNWGEPELHMSLAAFHLYLAAPDLGAAERHARAALAVRPDWHFVKEVLLPQITARQKGF